MATTPENIDIKLTPIYGADLPICLPVSKVVELEQAIDASGVSLHRLMVRAGVSVVKSLMENDDLKDKAKQVMVFAGSGNNGGDGWVAADLLADKGYEVTLICPKKPEDIKAEPSKTVASKITKKLDEIDEKLDDPDYAPDDYALSLLVNPSDSAIAALLKSADIVIDAMLGTGFTGHSVYQPLASWIRAIDGEKSRRNSAGESPLFVISADIPSGLSADAGTPAKPTVTANETVTMLTAKPGLMDSKARNYVGKVVISNLGVDVPSFVEAIYEEN